jgi:CubicO group peptidase (beta-lactamase class C family)
VPLTSADHFRIGSNTKTFVISVLLQLVAEKKLSLDDPLNRFSLGVTIPKPRASPCERSATCAAASSRPTRPRSSRS